MRISICVRTTPFIVIAALCLALLVSCAKKIEETVDVQLPKATPPAAEVHKPATEVHKPAAEQPNESAVATIEVVHMVDTAKKPRKAPVSAPTPAPEPEPEPSEPLPPPEPQPTLALVQIAGPKVITAGQTFSLTGDADGQGKAHGYAWTFKSGKDVQEMKTEGPRVTTTLNKAGEWTVTCKILWKDKIISSMVININVNAAAE